jgi:DNA-binding IclR family transcriptional regulator
MKSLASLSGETVLLTVISGWEVICIEKVEATRLIKLSLERGSSLPLHAGASSKILLAYQENSFIDSMFKKTQLTKFTDNTITDPARLKRELKAIVKQGFSFSDQEVDLGARAIGAPLFDHKGKVVGGLTVAGPRERISDREKERLIRLVKETAKRASHDLGYTEPR